MDVRDRSTYTSSLEQSAIEPSSRIRTEGPATASASSVAAPKSSVPDSSNVSPAARAASEAMQLPEVRQDRVGALQQQIASGSYKVAPQDVADAMLRNLRG